MQNYIINSADGGLALDTQKVGAPLFTVMSTSELQESGDIIPCRNELLHSLGSIRYCKAEVFKNCIIGTLRIPHKSDESTLPLAFAFCLTEQSLTFIEDSGDLSPLIEKLANKPYGLTTPDRLLLGFMELMIHNDSLYLSTIESETQELEDDVPNIIDDDFFVSLTKRRRKLSEFNAYYEQLTDISELLESQSCAALVQNAAEWHKFTRRAQRLQNHVQMLRVNMLQLRELYQSKLDAKQNKNMSVLTVVTTLFLPLTLLCGWYGMNFSFMPELNWRYGYIVVLAIAAAMIIGGIIFFKKKKFF